MYYQYKIALHDTCGNTSAMSLYHESCNFNYISGTLFQWNLYTIENSLPIQGYQLWKDSLSNGTWHVVTSAVGINANDPNYSVSPYASYRVEALGFNCAATRSTISSSHSNIKHQAIAIGINQLVMDNAISIYPNPANETVTIDVSTSKFKVSNLKVLNVIGEVVYQSLIVNPKSLIDISSYAKGIYTVEVDNENGSVFKKLVVQ